MKIYRPKKEPDAVVIDFEDGSMPAYIAHCADYAFEAIKKAAQQPLAHGQGLEFCPGHAAPVVNGYCFDCGLPRRPAGKA